MTDKWYYDKIKPLRRAYSFLPKETIDCAVEECIKEGILEEILRENREEVCSMLLTEYDEQAHIENEKEIAKEEGRKEGIQEGENLLATLVENKMYPIK